MSWLRNEAVDRQVARLGERAHVGRRAGRPGAAADQHERPLRRCQQLPQAVELLASGRGLGGLGVRGVGDRDVVRQHVLGQREGDRAGSPRAGGPERLLQQLRQPRGIVDLRDPLAELGQEAAVVDLLERLAVDHPASDLADQQHHRRRVLEGDVQARGGVRRAGPARDEADAGPARQLPVRLGHHRGAALLPGRDEADLAVQRVEHREVALARNAEHQVDALRAEPVDEHLTAGAEGHLRCRPCTGT